MQFFFYARNIFHFPIINENENDKYYIYSLFQLSILKYNNLSNLNRCDYKLNSYLVLKITKFTLTKCNCFANCSKLIYWHMARKSALMPYVLLLSFWQYYRTTEQHRPITFFLGDINHRLYEVHEKIRMTF